MRDTHAIRVADWMTKRVRCVELVDSLNTARQLMAKHRINQLPVLDNEKLVGIVTDRDIRDAYPTSMLIGRAKEIDRFAKSYTVEEAMTHNVFTVDPETPLMTAVSLLRRHRIGSLPVMKDNKLAGIITRSDVLDFVLSGAGGKKLRRRTPPKRKFAIKNRRTTGRRMKNTK
jgi:acetoin utilization protein AcuB